MEIKRDIDNLNVKKTVEMSVAGDKEFHFYVDELTADNRMPTYAGMADEKYAFKEMDDDFFEFLQRKIDGDGIFIRLVYATGSDSASDEAAFDLEYADSKETFRTGDLENVLVFECADYGIKVQGKTVTFGATVEGGCSHMPYFAEFASDEGNEKYLSLDNPLNRHVLKIMEAMIMLDE